MKNIQKVFKKLIFGMIGIGLWMAAEWMVGSYGEGNNHNGLIESNWATMPVIKFRLAMIIASVAAIFFIAGVNSAVSAINKARRKRYVMDFYMARIFELGAYAAAVSMMFNMAVRVILPLLYKELFNTRLMGAEIISTIEGVFYYVSVPFYVYYWVGIVGVSIGFAYFVLIGRLLVPRITFFNNPLFFVILKISLGTLEKAFIDDFLAAADGMGFLFMFGLIISFVTKIPAREQERRKAVLRNRRRERER